MVVGAHPQAEAFSPIAPNLISRSVAAMPYYGREHVRDPVELSYIVPSHEAHHFAVVGRETFMAVKSLQVIGGAWFVPDSSIAVVAM